MAQTLHLVVLTPERVLLSVEAALKVRVRLADGAWLSIYPRHAPLVAEMPSGPLQYETDLESGELPLEDGILRVRDNEVVVLTSGPASKQEMAPAEPEVQYDRLARRLMQALGASAEDVETVRQER